MRGRGSAFEFAEQAALLASHKLPIKKMAFLQKTKDSQKTGQTGDGGGEEAVTKCVPPVPKGCKAGERLAGF